MGIGENVGEGTGESTGMAGRVNIPPVSPPSGDGAIFFLSAMSLPADGYLTIYGFNFPNPATVKVNGVAQTVVNEAYADPYLKLHPALIQLGHDTGVFDETWDSNNQKAYQRIDVKLTSVSVGDTGLTVEGVGLVTDETGDILTSLVRISDTVTDFKVHSGNNIFVDLDAGSGGTGTEASPYNSLSTAFNAMSDGDSLYVRETASPMTSVFPTLSTANASATESQPRMLSAYPGEFPTWDQAVTGSVVTGPGGGNTIDYFTVHGFALVNSGGYGGGSFVGTGQGTGWRQTRWVANYIYGFGTGSSGAFIEISGHGSSFTDPERSQWNRLIGNMADFTYQSDVTEGMAHVYYFAGRRTTDGLAYLHNRNTRHVIGRVMQVYGHLSGEIARNLHLSFNNLEGAKHIPNKPNVLLCSHTDGIPGQVGASFYRDVDIEYNSISGGSTGIRCWGTAAVPGVGEYGILAPSFRVDGNVGYDNTGSDISIEDHYYAEVTNNLTEAAISYEYAPDGVYTISSGNTVDAPETA